MENNHEDQEPTLYRPPIALRVLREKATATLNIPPNLNPAEIRQFLGSAFFNEHATLILHVESNSRPIVFSPAPQTILGRLEQDDSDAICLNLSSYGAREQGVSRKHAMLHRSKLTLELQDLDSKNGTYLNGYRLAPNEMRILRDRDEVILGTLRIRIAFQYGSTE